MRVLAVLCCGAVLQSSALAWDANGHRAITTLAIQGLPDSMPSWLRDPNMVARIADEACVPDRWRSTHVAQLQHDNNPDHYIDIEDLDAYALEFKKIPNLRMEFIKELVEIRVKKGSEFVSKVTSGARDPDKTQEWPGFLPYAIMEQYGKVQSAFRVIRVLEQVSDPERAVELEQAKADASVNLGILAHYVGDAAQPLHTTKHHHGWVGENPKGYSTDRNFHSYIDGGVLRLHHIDAEMVKLRCKFTVKVSAADPWDEVLTYIDRSFHQVEPLYELKKTGELEKDPGKEFIEDRLADAATMLNGLVEAAWTAAEPKKADVDEFKKYDGGGK